MDLFAIVPIFIAVVAVIVFGAILYQAATGFAEWTRNNSLPKLAAPARIVSRRAETRGRGMTSSPGRVWTSYYVTFELESGERMEFNLHGREYGLLAEGDRGILTHQGTRYLGFLRRPPASAS